MIEILQDWLFNQIGINCDLTILEENNIFSDGIIIASILQKYGLLNDSFVQRMIPTNNDEQCEHNLQLLRPLFEMLKVNYDYNVVHGVVKNVTSIIITLLYELFVCLENKHHLYYVTKQSFNRVQENLITNSKLESLSVCIVTPENKTNDDVCCFEDSIIRNKDIIEWYKQKYKVIHSSLDEKLTNVRNNLCSKDKTHVKTTKKKCCFSYSDVSITSLQLPEIDTFVKNNSNKYTVDYGEFICNFKSKQYLNAKVMSIEQSIRDNLITKTWSEIMEKQNEIYNAIFAEIMIKQSQYEKQIVTKLLQTQNQINIENEIQIQAIKKVINESEDENMKYDVDLKKDFENLETVYKNEQKRVLELHRRLYKEKQEIIKRKIEFECNCIVQEIIELAIYSSEYKSEYDISVPKNVWMDWMQLFFKTEPIYIPFQKLNRDISEGCEINYDEVIEFESKESKVLTENDLDEYLYTCGRWFYEDICIEHEYIDEKILAFVVYRLLSLKYPPPPNPLPADIPSFDTAAVLLNFHGIDCIEQLKVLLSKPNIHVFDTDTVIKVCIDTFKKETNAPAEDGKKSKRKQSRSKKSANKDSKNNAKQKKNKDTNRAKRTKFKSSVDRDMVIEHDDNIHLVNKETQTSIAQEEVLPQRTPIGIIGEKVNTNLINGEELDNSTLVSAIIEYVKLLVGINGWILLNYPSTLKQAAELELALTGKYILPADELRTQDVDNPTIIIPVDDFIEKRKSKLLPSPPASSDDCFKTYFSVFIKVTDEADGANRTKTNESADAQVEDGNDINSNISMTKWPDKNADALEQFYSNQSVFTEFPFKSFDLFTLKKLARKILNKDQISITDSNELFGEESIYKITKGKRGSKSKLPLKHKDNKLEKGKKSGRKSKSNVSSIPNAEMDVSIEVKNGNNGEITNVEIDSPLDNTVDNMQPDDENWRNISMPIVSEVASVLATVWENIETNYIQNLCDIFNENRILHAGIVPYRAYVRDNVHKVINNPDLKQTLVNVFINDYNSINDDLRVLTDMKGYLHCKVLEMQNNLWKISEDRRECSEARRQEIINDNWLLCEICMLINNFLSLIQIEFERSVETMKLINDYYLIMLNRDLPTSVNLSVHSVRRLTVNSLLLLLSDIKNRSFPSNDSLYSKTGENLISRILIDCKPDDECLEFLSSFLHQEIEVTSMAILTNAQHFYNLIKTERDYNCLTSKNTPKSKKSFKPKTSLKNIGKKSKSASVTKPENKQTFVPNSSNNAIDLLLKEWSFAIDVELKRFNFRMELIKKRSGEDIMEYFCFIEDVFCALHDLILQRYDREVLSINNLCDFIQTAIEEETPITKPIILDQDRFFIDISMSSGEQHVEDRVNELIEESDGCQFTINQLNKLTNIFKIAGPYGVIRKQPFIYIIQDLMLFNAADNVPHLPLLWNSLNETQLQNVLDSIFGPEYAIDWRDFIIYNLDIPYPSSDQILSLRKQFLLHDHENTEVITLECFENTVLWFEEELPQNPQRALRIVLIKRLLFEIFQVDFNSVNYTALLLYFCKDLDPVGGFKKALVLSVGKQVVTSEDELNGILKEEAELKKSVIKLLNDLVDSVVDNRGGVLIYEIFPHDLDNYIKEPSDIESSYSVSYSTSKSHSNDTYQDSASVIGNQDHDSLTLSYKTYSLKDLEKHWVSRIPVDTVVSVLNACFHHQDKTFNIRNLYLNCLEEEADEDGMIDGFDLVNLSCIQQIFTITNKFKISSPCNILKESYH